MSHRNVYTHLLVEDGLGLTTITGLLSVVTALSLRDQRGLPSLVLGNFVRAIRHKLNGGGYWREYGDVRVLSALLSLADCFSVTLGDCALRSWSDGLTNEKDSVKGVNICGEKHGPTHLGMLTILPFKLGRTGRSG